MRYRTLIACGIALVAIASLLGLRACVHEAPPREGTIHLPRDGRYVFGAQAARPPRIVVDGRAVSLQADRFHPGVWTGAIDLQAGSVTFAVTGPGRLVWHPPGRRGPPEYLPASAFGRGGARTDGWIALGIAVIVLALVGFLAWPRLRAIDRTHAAAFAAVFVLALGVRLWDLGGAGQTFDEEVSWTAGKNQLANRLAFDYSQPSWIWNAQHPPLTKDIVGLGAALDDGWGPARALSALQMALGCALLTAIGRRLWDLRAGIAAGVIAALTPHLVAHGKVVGHEAPTVLWWTLAIYLCLRAFDGEPGRRRLLVRFAGIGVVLGLAISTRWVNALLAPMIGATLLLAAPRAYLARTLAFGAAVIPATALVTCVVLWPRLWADPIEHIRFANSIVSKGHGAESFLGRRMESPPHYYFLAYLFATAPAGILLGVLAFLARSAARLRGGGSDERPTRSEWRSAACALLLFAIPLGAELSPVRQDGVRYVMPSVVALSLMAGAAVAWLRGRVFVGVLAAFTLYLAIVCARIHPYYLDYYGEQVGGPAGAYKNFELGWWGEGVDAAVRHVGAHVGPDETVYRECMDAYHLAWWPWPIWARLARRPADADWIVVQPATKPCPIPDGFELDHTITAQGAPLIRIYHRAR